MGYTRYWDRTDKPISPEFMDEVSKIISDSIKRGINICGSDGNGAPVITEDVIAFNGDASKGLDHETCFFANKDDIGFNFCKTARKPYDYTVRKVLDAALTLGIVTNVRDDGPNEGIYSDDDYLNGKVDW